MLRLVREGKHKSFGVHTFGPRSSGKPVSPWFNDRGTAEKVALNLAKKTGRKYVILARVSGVI